MIMIVYYHCICCYGVWQGYDFSAQYIPFYNVASKLIVNISLPIFTMVAGYLYAYLYERGKYRNKKIFLFNKTKRLILPYITIGILLLFLQPWRELPSMLKGISHLWYLLFLFECFMIVSLLKINTLPPPNCKSMLIIILWSVIANIRGLDCAWGGLNSLFKYFPYFFLGMMLLHTKETVKLRKGYIVVGLIISTALLVLNEISQKRVPLVLFYALLPCLVAGIFYIVSKMRELKDNVLLKNLDKWSMGIYVLHHILIQQFFNTINPMNYIMVHFPIIYPFMLFVMVMTVSAFLVWLLQHYKWSRYVIG